MATAHYDEQSASSLDLLMQALPQGPVSMSLKSDCSRKEDTWHLLETPAVNSNDEVTLQQP